MTEPLLTDEKRPIKSAGQARGRPRVRRLEAAVALAVLTLAAAPAMPQAPEAPRGPQTARGRSAAADRFRARVKAARALGKEAAQGRLLQFLEGIDPDFRPIPKDTQDNLKDPLAVLLFNKGVFPPSLDEALKALDARKADPQNGVPDQRSYLVGEGGQIPFSPATKDLDRSFRWVVARLKGADANVLFSAPAPAPAVGGFLQAIAWDDVNGVFNYYERLNPSTWAWRGNSRHALSAPTRGQGCFDCHVNGSLVMKELKFPWQNWHSMDGPVHDAVPDDSPLGKEALFVNKTGAEDLQVSVVQPGISRWGAARAAGMVGPSGDVRDTKALLRHLFESTSVNLTTSRVESRAALDKPLPLTFFLNKDILFDPAVGLKPPADFQAPKVDQALYQNALTAFRFALVSDGFQQPGETFFAFLTPEPAFEDLDVLRRLIGGNVITPKFAACVLMVDFPNPVFSPLRQRLSAYVPDAATVKGGQSDLPAKFADAVKAAAAGLPADSAEAQFLANWTLPDDQWRPTFEGRIKAYLTAVTPRLKTQEGVNDYVRLAESRRREFGARPLHEAFPLMLPVSNIPPNAPPLQMNADATVGPKPADTRSLTPSAKGGP
jgi:hypothetical protein